MNELINGEKKITFHNLKVTIRVLYDKLNLRFLKSVFNKLYCIAIPKHLTKDNNTYY